MRNKISERFGRARVLLPVVHCADIGQAQTAVATAMENGADGVFLINQGGMNWRAVVGLAEAAVRAGVSFVGVNLLNVIPEDALLAAGTLHGLWTDGAGFEVDITDGYVDSIYAKHVEEMREACKWKGTYFGGVAFKYAREVPPQFLPALARAAVDAKIDVITTSGAATGAAPTIDKIAAMRGAIGDHALAIASGITPENVAPFLPLCDAFLVATGIESSFGVFDTGRVRALADAIHGGVS